MSDEAIVAFTVGIEQSAWYGVKCATIVEGYIGGDVGSAFFLDFPPIMVPSESLPQFVTCYKTLWHSTCVKAVFGYYGTALCYYLACYG